MQKVEALCSPGSTEATRKAKQRLRAAESRGGKGQVKRAGSWSALLAASAQHTSFLFPGPRRSFLSLVRFPTPPHTSQDTHHPPFIDFFIDPSFEFWKKTEKPQKERNFPVCLIYLYLPRLCLSIIDLAPGSHSHTSTHLSLFRHLLFGTQVPDPWNFSVGFNALWQLKSKESAVLVLLVIWLLRAMISGGSVDSC